jgi:hypothetical protein
MNDIISFARRVESDLCHPNTELMDCFFQTATRWWQKADSNVGIMRECVLSNENIITVAIKCGSYEFLKARLISTSTRADATMLNRTLYPPQDKFVSVSVVENLLELGANPNQVVDFMPLGIRGKPQSPWQNALSYLAVEFPFVVEQDKLVLLRRWERILKLLLQNGARTSVYCRGPQKRARAQRLESDSAEADDAKEDKGRKSMEVVIETTLTPTEVFQKTFEKYPDMLSGLLRLLEAKGHPPTENEKLFVQTPVVPQISKTDLPKQRYRDRVKKFFRAEKTS